MHIGGNLAFSASDGQRDAAFVPPHAGFAIGPLTAVVDADVSDRFSVLWEIRTFNSAAYTGLLYARADRLFGLEGVNAELGRVQIPFGEEYIRAYYPIDNPLVTNTVAFPWGYDVGAKLFGEAADKRISWDAAVLNGSEKTNATDGDQRSFAGRVRFKPVKGLQATLSALTTGRNGSDAASTPGKAALEIGGYNVGALGSSNEVSAQAYGADLVIGSGSPDELWLSGGFVGVRRPADASGRNMNRNLWYGSAEGRHDFTSKLYAAARWSFLKSDVKDGTAEPIEAANGWDAGSLSGEVSEVDRLSVGVGWRVDPRAVVKLEYAADYAALLSAPASRPRKNVLIGQVAVRF